MQLLVAYGLDEGVDDTISSRLADVARHYESLWGMPVTRHGIDAQGVGLHVWDATDSPWKWPVWREDATLSAATLYFPLGYERVVGELPAEHASLPLCRALLDNPGRVADITAPFVVAALEPGPRRLTMTTDAFGLGRLYEMRFDGGWVWSNRPAAACRFARVGAEADGIGWRTFAATGWFMGRHTPFAGVYAVSGGTQVGYDARTHERFERRQDILGTLAAPPTSDALTPHRVSELSEALRGVARSVTRMWAGPIVVDLSGGRDSRLVAASFLSAGVQVELHTNAAEAGEGETARQLVAALPYAVGHRVVDLTVESDGRDSGAERPGGATSRAFGWHRLQEGLRSATYLRYPPPSRFSYPPSVAVGGAAGEIAHGHYYPPNYEELATVSCSGRLDAFLGPLVAKVVRKAGVTMAAQEAASFEVRRVLLEAEVAGLRDARMLDYFYAAERLRRWGTTAESIGVVSPLLSPEFVRAAFHLTPSQRRDNALHRALTARLIPEWAAVPYYQRPQHVIQPALRPNLGSDPSPESISQAVRDTELWGDAFEPQAVRHGWELLQRGEARPADEKLIQRVIWRSAFEEYLAEVNRGNDSPSSHRRSPGPPAERAPAVLPPVATPGLVARSRHLVARSLRKAARAIDAT